MLKKKLNSYHQTLKGALSRFEKPALIIGSALGLTAILMSLEFNLLEANLYDFRMSHGVQPDPSQEILLVTLDDATTRALNDFPPLTLDVHAKFVEALSKYEPALVGYLVNMSNVNQLSPEQFNDEWGERFVDAAKKLEENGTPFIMGTQFDINGEVLPPYPLSVLEHALAQLHKDTNVFSQGVSRRIFTTFYGKPNFHMLAAQKLGYRQGGSMPTGSLLVPEIEGSYFYFRYHGDPSIMDPEYDGEPQDTYQQVSFIDVLNGRILPETLKNKVILVGTMTQQIPNDLALTPYSKKPFVAPKLLIHASILDSVIKDNGLVLARPWINWIITFFLTSFVIWWVLNSTPLYGIFIPCLLSLGFALVCQLLFQGLGNVNGLWLRMSQPLAGIFISYYLVIPYRLIREYKKRWDFQRKNELLLQVEELKTNFLSLVTHDLKTPVARIQGLAEVLMSKAATRLVDRDRETLKNIINATDDLNHFISTILELNKVETRGIEIRPESRDINRLIEESAQTFKAPAKSKGIDLRLELEPLFPIKVDPTLMGKILNNLIDNALKYSPQGSEVTVRSQEVDHYVEISVQDQGIGMSEDEIKNLFTKFYRVNNSSTTGIKGTGLGLYLTKYFLEAQQGRIGVESVVDEGSTFKILLPLELDEAKLQQTFRPGRGEIPAGLTVQSEVEVEKEKKEKRYV